MKNIKKNELLICRINIYFYILIAFFLSAASFILFDFIPKKYTHSIYINVEDLNTNLTNIENITKKDHFDSSINKGNYVDLMLSIKYSSINLIANYLKDISVINKINKQVGTDLSLSDLYKGISVQVITYNVIKLNITLDNKENIIKFREQFKKTIQSFAMNKSDSFLISFIQVDDDSVEIFPTTKIKFTLSMIIFIVLSALRFHFRRK